MQGFSALLLSFGVIAAFILALGGVLAIRRGDRLRGWLMIGVGIVTLINVALIAVPIDAPEPPAAKQDISP